MTGLWERVFGHRKDPEAFAREAVLAESENTLRLAKLVAEETIIANEERVKEIRKAVKKEEAALIQLAGGALDAFKRDGLR